MYDEEISYFKSAYDKNICLYGKQTIHEPLHLTVEQLYDRLINERPLPSTQVCFGVRIAGGNHGWILIFERLSFSINNIVLLRHMFSNTPKNINKKLLIEGVFFIDCRFITPVKIEEQTEVDLCFRNCVFERDLIISNNINSNIIFNKCKFREAFEYKNIMINYMFYIEECVFNENSIVNFSKTTFGSESKFVIRDTQFSGKFEIEDTNINGTAVLKNLSFFNPFKINSLKLSENCTFKNFAFFNANSKGMLEAQEKFANTLKSNKYLLEIEELGLNQITKETTDFDYDAYKVAYETGYLKSEYAAYLLEKSVSYLGQKRKKDRENPSRDSIPFTGVGKNIKYPVEALLAYKAKDWDKLKELRQKYKEIED